jgi:hypothetical protein
LTNLTKLRPATVKRLVEVGLMSLMIILNSQALDVGLFSSVKPLDDRLDEVW